MKTEPKTFKYKVSRLTKPWALSGVEAVIRALSGDAIKPEDIITLEINNEEKSVKKKRIKKK